MNRKLESIVSAEKGAMEMKKKTPLTKALDAMSCIPFASFAAEFMGATGLTVAGIEAGTLFDPKVDVILEKSVQSSFGRGSETVLDPSYHNGREIPAENIKLNDKDQARSYLYDNVKSIMFLGHTVDIKLYKLAIYETDGHFDWHRDSAHSDKHLATLLVALNTSWEGGELVLGRNEIETPIDLRPNRNSDGTYLQVVAFFTDTEHRVEPVKSGIHIVLQYDIELLKKPRDEEKDEVAKEKDEETDDEEKDEEKDEEEEEKDEEETDDEDKTEPWMGRVKMNYYERMQSQVIAQATENKEVLERMLTIIKEMHRSGIEEVAFALQHLYRGASVSAEYLKGSDSTLYNALLASGGFQYFYSSSGIP